MGLHYAKKSKNNPKVVGCGKSTSFYKFIGQQFGKCESTGPMHRVCSLLRKMDVTHYVFEELEMDEELSVEINDLRKALGSELKRGTKTESLISRLTFFRSPAKKPLWNSVESDQVLGYVLLLDFKYRLRSSKQARIKYIYEAVMRLPTHPSKGGGIGQPLTNHYFHVARVFSFRIGTSDNGFELCIPGTYFCQQNGISHVCAHAVLRMAINSSPTTSRESEITAHDINAVLGIPFDKTVIGRGLGADDLVKFCNARGFDLVQIDLRTEPKSSYSTYPYQLIETGVPTMLCISGWEIKKERRLTRKEYAHLVAVVGHTMNTDRWTPEARIIYTDFGAPNYTPAASWTDHFLINDDNLGMHCSLPSEALVSNLIPAEDPHMRIAVVFGLVPKGVRAYSTIEANAARITEGMIKFIEKNPAWCKTKGYKPSRWLKHLKKNLVTRPLLLRGSDYARHFAEITGQQSSESEIVSLAESFPEFLWLVELTEPNLYSANRSKVGEIVFDARSTRPELEPLFFWIPGLRLSIFDDATKILPEFWPVTDHVPLYVTPTRLGPTSDW